MNLVLVGVRGSGKSAAGAAVASRIGLAFIDLDREIEKLAGKTVTSIFEEDGETAFRHLEARALTALSGREGMVVATGGGVVLSTENREKLRKLGVVVWLQVSPRKAVLRMDASTHRPPLTSRSPREEARHVEKQRFRLYQEIADRVIDTDKRSLQEVCHELEQLWRSLPDDHFR